MLHTSLGLPRSAARCLHSAKHLRHRRRRHLVTLAIETSCDDTCVALLEYDKHGGDATLHFHEKVTAPNTGKGGIVPIEAATSHRAHLAKLVHKALRSKPWQTGVQQQQQQQQQQQPALRPDFISVTRGPGMYSNLSCGLDTAKGLATALDIPLIGVHHMQAHALTPRLMNALQRPSGRPSEGGGHEPAFPFLTLLVSGGHTMLLRSESLTRHSIVANTLDIAIGDCLDKCGRAILPASITATAGDTAFARHLSAYAFADPAAFSSYAIPARRADEIDRAVNAWGWRIQPPLSETRRLAFSYAGFVSHVQRIVADRGAAGQLDAGGGAERRALARAALGAAFEHLCSRVIIALEAGLPTTTTTTTTAGTTPSTLVVSGGVAANDFLRYFLRGMLDARGFPHVKLVFPPIRARFEAPKPGTAVVLEPCTDNAAMIAWAGVEMYRAGWYSDLGINAMPKWSLDESVDGGIAGATSRHAHTQEADH